jgi:hypothetical protein
MTDDHATEPAQAEPLPYREITDETYAHLAAENFTVEEPKPGTLVLRGPCPRCNAIIGVPVVTSIFRSTRLFGGGTRRPRQTTAPTSHIEPMMCTCDDEHPNRPEGGYGCGAFWTLVMSKQDL